MAKRGRKPKDKKEYFSDIEEEAVAIYNNSTDEVERNRIFNTILYPAFVKMIESIIRRYKLYVPDEEFSQTLEDTVSYLMMKIKNFKPDKGKKAFSYCGTVCKYYLIAKNKNFVKERQRSTSFDEHLEELSTNSSYTTHYGEDSSVAEKMIKIASNNIKDMIANREENELTDNEVKVGLALIELLDNWEDILIDDNPSLKLQKSGILYFLREETCMSTKDVRENMRKYKTLYNLSRKNLIESE